MNLRKPILFVAFALLLWPVSGSAQVFWRLSIKVFTDSNGQRPSGCTDQEIRDNVSYNNLLLTSYARGCLFSVSEIVQLPSSLSSWYNRAARNSENRDELLTAAEDNAALYRYRDHSINVYINNSSSGICCGSGNGLVFMGNDAIGATSVTLIHEIGHYLGLPHTQGVGCNGCCTPDENLSCCDVPGDDEVSDTIPDLACWTINQVSMNRFGKQYLNLLSNEKTQVDDVWNNIMSYHSGRVRMTPGQLDKLSTFSNNDRANVMSSLFRFVSSSGDDGNDGLSADGAFRTVSGAIAGSTANDVLLIRAGTYARVAAGKWRITSNRVLCSRKGTVRLTNTDTTK